MYNVKYTYYTNKFYLLLLLVCFVLHILSPIGEDKVKKMDIGTYSFPFKYMLPQKIPASFESPDGFIRYSVTTYMDTASLGLQTAVAFFSVNAILDLNKIPMSAVCIKSL